MLWAQVRALIGPQCSSTAAYPPSPLAPAPLNLAVGPTGDLAVGSLCEGTTGHVSVALRLNGSGNALSSYAQAGYNTGSQILGFDRHGDLIVLSNWLNGSLGGWQAAFAAIGPGGTPRPGW